MIASTPIAIDSLDDPRLVVYRNLKDRDVARHGDLFIAESKHVVRRLLESDYPVESVLVGRKRAEEIAPIVPATASLYVAPDVMVHQIVGFKFHSGVIACGRRKPASPLDQVVPAKEMPSTIVICPDLNNNENLGSLIRIASGFGIDAMILGEQCCDPFYRLSIRVSMGTIFNMPMVRSQNIVADLARLRQLDYELIAAVLADDAEPLASTRRGKRVGILFGNEAQGLPPAVVAGCDRRVTIPMQRGTDSLNVSVAAGIFLYHFARPA